MTHFIETDASPIPAGAEVGIFTPSDGTSLRCAFFPCDNAIATIIVAPGFAEFIEKYFEVIDDLRARRFNVAMMDWRGQGLSPAPDHWNGYFDLLTQDLKEFRDGPVTDRFPEPCYLLTHSMGGLPALILLASGDVGFQRAALCAPATQLFPAPQNAFLGIVGKALMAMGWSDKLANPSKDARQFDGNMFTTDRVRHERFRSLQDAEPRAMLLSPTYGWVHDAMRASNTIHAENFFDALKTPVRIISAGDERRIHGPDHAVIASKNTLIDHVTVDGALHEIMMERDELRTVFWHKVDEFFSPGST